MTPLLSSLVEDGLATARIAFGVDGQTVAAAALADAGSAVFSTNAPSGAVGILMTNDRPTVSVILGAIATGASIVSLPLPGRNANLSSYISFLTSVQASFGLQEIVVNDQVATVMSGAGLKVRSHSDLWARPVAAPASDGFQLVQFTSGSTASPKAVVLDDAALGANVASILDAVRPRRGDVAVSWLPLSHDMGLVGILLVGIAAAGHHWAEAGEIVLLDPAHFLRRPAIWLEAIHRWRGSVTASPDFGYRMATQPSPSGAFELTSLRCAIVGGEITRFETLLGFDAAYRHHGFSSTAFCPAYGMAELGLAATMTLPEEHWRSLRVSTLALAEGCVEVPDAGEPETTVVGSGSPLPGYTVRCDAPRGATGDISVRGPSIGFDGTTGVSFAGSDGWYLTGDTGYADERSLYVCGRIDDYLVAHGRNLYAPAIEATLSEIDGVRAGRVAATGVPNGEWVIVAEPDSCGRLTAAESNSVRRAIRRAAVGIATAQPDEIVLVERGTLPLTPSGKLQRNEVRSRWLKDTLARLP